MYHCLPAARCPCGRRDCQACEEMNAGPETLRDPVSRLINEKTPSEFLGRGSLTLNLIRICR